MQLESDLGPSSAVFVNHTRHHLVGGGVHESDPQRSRATVSMLLHEAVRVVGLGKEAQRAGIQQRSGVGEADATSAAIEEHRVELAFEQADLLAERRLRHVEALGGPPEVQFLGNRHEVSKPLKVHASCLAHAARRFSSDSLRHIIYEYI